MKRAAVLVLLASMAAGCSESSSEKQAIPWSPDRPPPVAKRQLARPCKNTDLRPSAFLQSLGSGSGHMHVGGVILTKVGAEPCALRGRPTLRFIGESARRTKWHFRRVKDFGREAPPRLGSDALNAMLTGEAAWVQFIWSNWCPPESTAKPPTVIALRLPAQQRSLLVRDTDSDRPRYPPCNSPGEPSTIVSTRFLSRDIEPKRSSRVPLEAEIVRGEPLDKRKLPQLHATAGREFHYEVALTNVSRRPVRFADCPVYQVSASFLARREETVPWPRQTFVLNCKEKKTLDPGERALFAMVIDVPRFAKPGSHSLSWLLAPDSYLSPFARGIVDVTR